MSYSNKHLTNRYYSVTLGKSLPKSEGEVGEPPWAKATFSHRFTGTVPVETYELMHDFEELCA